MVVCGMYNDQVMSDRDRLGSPVGQIGPVVVLGACPFDGTDLLPTDCWLFTVFDGINSPPR